MIDKRLLRKINFIEIYQIIGGIIGLLFTSYLLFTTNLSRYVGFIDWVSIITPFIFFGFCIYSGILLNNKRYVIGFKLVFISLIIQLLSFDILGLFYAAINGIGINLTIDLTKDIIVGFDFHPSQFLIALYSYENSIVKINLVAIAMIFYTSTVFQEIKNR